MDSPRYRKLKVWITAHENALEAIKLLDLFDKKYQSVGKQFLAAITSISANIAEGSGGYQDKEFVRFLNIALRSAFEVDNWLQLIKDAKIITMTSRLEKMESSNLEVIRMLVKLIRSQQK